MLGARLQALTASGEMRQSLETEQHELWLFNSFLLRKEVCCPRTQRPIWRQHNEAQDMLCMQNRG
jgi:hypothetical protein